MAARDDGFVHAYLKCDNGYELFLQIRISRQKLLSVAFLDEGIIAIGQNDGNLYFISLSARKTLSKTEVAGKVLSVALLGDGKLVLCGVGGKRERID